MLEELLLTIFSIISVSSLCVGLVITFIAIFRKNKAILKMGLAIAVIPISLYGIILIYYNIYIPYQNHKQKMIYAGSYVQTDDEKASGIADKTVVPLILKSDNTFTVGKNNFTTFYGKGIWKVGSVEAKQLEFRDNTKNVLFWATATRNNILILQIPSSQDSLITFKK